MITAAGETSDPVPAVVGTRDEPHPVLGLGIVRDALAGVEERQRQLAHLQLRALIEEPHSLRGVHHRAAADRDDRVGLNARQHLNAGAHLRLRRLGLDVGEHVHGGVPEVAPDLVDHADLLAARIRDDERLLDAQLAQALERAGVEVGVRGHPEPLWRRLAMRDGLDVEEVAVVDVVGRVRSAPRAAAERERRRHRVVDATERADRRRRVDQDPAGPDHLREAI